MSDHLQTKVKRMVGGVLRRGGRVLLCRRHRDRVFYPSVWDLPGGHVDEKECSGQALTRELEEELGIKVELSGGVPWRTLRNSEFEFDVFIVDQWQGEPENRAPLEHEQIGWFSRTELSRLVLAHPCYVELLTSALHTPACCGHQPVGTHR